MADTATQRPIHDLFQVHKLNAQGIERAENLARQFSELLYFVESVAGLAPQVGRDLALVRTKLQEASFHAKRAMAQNPDNQLPKE